MPAYVPTETDRATGARVRQLRKLAGETLVQTIDRAGLGCSPQTLSRIELGERPLSLPEATKLAAHFNTTVDKVIIQTPVAEQVWLGNDKPALFAVPDRAEQIEAELSLAAGDWISIDRENPMTPDEHRLTVWIPYLENRYSTDAKAS